MVNIEVTNFSELPENLLLTRLIRYNKTNNITRLKLNSPLMKAKVEGIQNIYCSFL